MNGGILPLNRRDFLKALGAAGGVAVFSSGAWGCIGGRSTNAGPTVVRSTGDLLYTVADKVQGRFADYIPIPVSIKPSLKDYSVGDVSSISNIDRMGVTDAGKSALAKNLFYLTASGDSQIYDVYKSLDNAKLPAFVTTDSVLHANHVLFDYILRILEVRHFSPDIISLSRQLFEGSKALIDPMAEPMRTPALKNTAFFAVALTLLGESPDVPWLARDMVQSELALINGHQGFARSPIFGYEEDYSQYVPRGHYTRNDTLKKYFMAMMWYGRMMFRLASDNPELVKQQTRSAILITLALQDKAFDVWKGVYEPTVFFVGESDDLSVLDYKDLMISVYGKNIDPVDLKDDAKLQAFIDKALALKEPKIISTLLTEADHQASGMDTVKGFRFMGQRFIPDSHIFQELVNDKVANRFFPMGLDVLAALSSSRAYELLDKVYGETRYVNYIGQMDSLKKEFAAQKDDTWTQNLYWNWLYCLMALLNEKGDGYPTFMKIPAWTDKELNASLGSWTELRHDTILYAKQSYAMKSGGEFEIKWPELFPPEPHGYVEPNPELYGRLASLAALMSDGLKSRGLLDGVFSDRLSQFNSLLISLKSISEKELTDNSLSKDDYSLIRHFGNSLESITTVPPDVADTITSDIDKKMAVVADVHTDPNSGQVLEEGVGKPYHIYVVVPIDGKLTLTEGAAFSYYEFKQPMGDRMTDEKWQDLLKNGQAPETPEWTKGFKA